MVRVAQPAAPSRPARRNRSAAEPVPVAAPVAMPGELPPPSFDPPAMETPAASMADSVADAVAEFKKGNYSAVAKQFAANAANLTEEQKRAWVYCRVKLAAEAVSAPKCEPATAAACVADLTEACRAATRPGQRSDSRSSRPPPSARAWLAPSGQGRCRDSELPRPAFGQPRTGRPRRQVGRGSAQEIFERWSGPPSALVGDAIVITRPRRPSRRRPVGRPRAPATPS
jgi:hypothetical protein